ncbi:MAG: adenylosuccinate synthetase [Caldilineaceae bacterium]
MLFANLYHKPAVRVDEVVTKLYEDVEALLPLVTDTTALLHNALHDGKQVLLEGQLEALRDPIMASIPIPLPLRRWPVLLLWKRGHSALVDHRGGRGDKGLFELCGCGTLCYRVIWRCGRNIAQARGDSGEYGDHRPPRRVGWFDAVAARYGCMVQGATAVALTNLDVLGYLAEIPICTAYRIDGEESKTFPTTGVLQRATPELTTLPGWRTDLRGIRSYDELPAAARRYIETIEALIEVPIRYISVGPEREALIVK